MTSTGWSTSVGSAMSTITRVVASSLRIVLHYKLSKNRKVQTIDGNTCTLMSIDTTSGREAKFDFGDHHRFRPLTIMLGAYNAGRVQEVWACGWTFGPQGTRQAGYLITETYISTREPVITDIYLREFVEPNP